MSARVEPSEMVIQHLDGSIAVTRAGPRVLVARELLDDPPDPRITYADGVLTIAAWNGTWAYERVSTDGLTDTFALLSYEWSPNATA